MRSTIIIDGRRCAEGKDRLKMATGGAGTRPQYLTVSVSFDGTKAVLHVPTDLKVGEAIQKAAVEFKQPPQGLTFLYHGLEITDDMEVGVSAAGSWRDLCRVMDNVNRVV